MTKKVIKEIIIALLLCLAIILILGVLLYEYVPSNKIIPDTVSYTTPEAVREELSKSEDVEYQENQIHFHHMKKQQLLAKIQHKVEVLQEQVEAQVQVVAQIQELHLEQIMQLLVQEAQSIILIQEQNKV